MSQLEYQNRQNESPVLNIPDIPLNQESEEEEKQVKIKTPSTGICTPVNDQSIEADVLNDLNADEELNVSWQGNLSFDMASDAQGGMFGNVRFNIGNELQRVERRWVVTDEMWQKAHQKWADWQSECEMMWDRAKRIADKA